MVAVGILIQRIQRVECNSGQVFHRGRDIEDDRAMIGQAGQKVGYDMVFAKYEKCVIPAFDQMLVGNTLDFREVHQHAVGGIVFAAYDITGQRDFKDVAMPVQMAALSFVVGNAMTCIEFEATGNLHEGFPESCRADAEAETSNVKGVKLKKPAKYTIRPMTPLKQTLTTSNHDRERAGLRYVYPVVSRRAGGVSIGINLNPNNACNWACIYCQVPNLTRGGPPPLDLHLLELELNTMLDDVEFGDFMETQVAADARRLMDIAFSGNGEPTSAPEFADAVALVTRIVRERNLGDLKLRLITNGSLVQRRHVREGLRLLAEAGGEVWFKIDAVEPERVLLLNGVHQKPDLALTRLKLCASLAPTWVQTCMMSVDGLAPSEAELNRYLDLLAAVRGQIHGVLLYGLARTPMQPGAERLAPLPASWMEALGRRVENLGLPVLLSP